MSGGGARKVIACINVTLDGVMQGPGRQDEDSRNGFRHGGWAAPYGAMAHVGDLFASTDALLLGRRTYDDFHSVWPKRVDSPFTPWLNAIRKYVVSTTARAPLPWQNSTLLTGNPAEAIEALKREPGRNLLILGSGVLIRSLAGTSVIDEIVLLRHPLVLGSGTPLFGAADRPWALTLVDSSTTPSGVVISRYRTAS